jgi:dienelactone hydrolase
MSSKFDNDPLSDILRLLGAQPVVAGGFSAGGTWAIRFPRPKKIKFFALVKGSCVDG